jgi:hypothetical protein
MAPKPKYIGHRPKGRSILELKILLIAKFMAFNGKLDEQFRKHRMAAICRVWAGHSDVLDLSGFARSAGL